MPDLLVRQQLFQITIGQVAYGITAIGAHGWGLIALPGRLLFGLMGASICCAEAEADTQFTIFDLSALKKQCLSAPSKLGASYGVKVSIG